VGPSADIYALGCTLYYAVTGRVPFPGGSRKEKMQRHLTDTPDPVRRLAPHLSDAFCRVIDDMMAKTPEKRIASATTVVERLRPWLPDGQTWNGRGLAVAEAMGGDGRDGLRPPPLPSLGGGSDRSSGSSFFGTSDSSGGTSTDIGETIVAVATNFHRSWIARLVMRALLVAVPGGIGFGWVMSMVRSIEPEQFDAILRDITPAGLGMRAFLLLFVLQVAAGAAGRWRR
jgi:serine/threonine protein kinase